MTVSPTCAVLGLVDGEGRDSVLLELSVPEEEVLAA